MSQTRTAYKNATEPTVLDVLEGLLRETAYSTPSISDTNETLENIMRAEMNARGIACPQLEKTLHLTSSLIELGYHECTLAEKTTIALYTWYIIYVDDISMNNVEPFAVFTQRFVTRLPQLDPVLEALAEILMRMCDQWDTQAANYILAATLNYVNATCLEPEINATALMRGAVRFPWFFRHYTGLSIAFSLMAFPKLKGVNFMDYVQVLEDMNFWKSRFPVHSLCFVPSFHKEELAGKTGNYVHNCTCVEAKAPSSVLVELAQEVITSQKTIYAAFAHLDGLGVRVYTMALDPGLISINDLEPIGGY